MASTVQPAHEWVKGMAALSMPYHARAFYVQAARERQVALQPAAGPKSAAAFALMASAAQSALKEVRSMTEPLKAPELTPAPSAKHVIGGGTAQVPCVLHADPSPLHACSTIDMLSHMLAPSLGSGQHARQAPITEFM